MKKTILKAQDVCRFYVNGKRRVDVLKHVDLDLYEGDFTIIMGRSGAGKSTLLYALSGMDGIDHGQVLFGERSIHRMKPKEKARLWAQHFGFVFQQSQLVSSLTILENVLVAGYVSGKEKSRLVQKRAETLFQQMQIQDIKDHFPWQVSGGEAQRASIARAMVTQPSLLFADEPTGALNKANTREVLSLMSDLHRQGQSIVMVSHDLPCALRGNRILYLEDGQVQDELRLPDYNELNEKERYQQISRWLDQQAW